MNQLRRYLDQHRRAKLTSASGFTLMELLVSIALISILSIMLVGVVTYINRTHTRTAFISEMQTQGSQAVETIERAIRSSSEASVHNGGAGGCVSQASHCLRLLINNETLEHQLNGQCRYTFYAWYAPNGSSSNGRMERYARDMPAPNSFTNCGPTQYSLFNTDRLSGTSVEMTDGVSHIFEVDGSSVDNVTAVKINMTLRHGVGQPTLGSSSRPQVFFNTTVNLRNL